MYCKWLVVFVMFVILNESKKIHPKKRPLTPFISFQNEIPPQLIGLDDMSMFVLISLGFMSLTLAQTCLIELAGRCKDFRNVRRPMMGNEDPRIYSFHEEEISRIIIDILKAGESAERNNIRTRRGDFMDIVFMSLFFPVYISFLMWYIFY